MIVNLFFSCGSTNSERVNAVYFWKTIWKLDSTEYNFIKKYNIQKLYLRYFDLVEKNGKIVPNASLTQGRDAVNINCEIVPTIFIDYRCLNNNILDYVEKIVERIGAMSKTLDIANVKCIQIDCDYTAKTLDNYYKFLSEIKQLFKQKNMSLSVTIRLHQLSMKAPDVDYGVLMLYNTGDFKNRDCKNPILDFADVQPYLKNLKKYRLPLKAAYPNFEWKLLFNGKNFKHILYGEDISDTLVYKRISENTYKVISTKELPLSPSPDASVIFVNAGNDVVIKKSVASHILKVRQEVEYIRSDIGNEIIFYDLNSANIGNLSDSEYKIIFGID